MADVPGGMSPDAAGEWSSPALIDAWLADFGFEFELRPGEDVPLADDPEAVAAARRFRDVLGRFPSGVTVVTSMAGGVPVGMTCQSFSSVSLNPPLVLFCPSRTSRAWPLIQLSGSFAVNLLAEDQAELSTTMATRGVDKFADVAWKPSPSTGSPVLEGTLGYLDCSLHTVHEAGDHFVVIGRVLDLHSSEAPHALTFYQGRYGTTAAPREDRWDR